MPLFCGYHTMSVMNTTAPGLLKLQVSLLSPVGWLGMGIENKLNSTQLELVMGFRFAIL